MELAPAGARVRPAEADEAEGSVAKPPPRPRPRPGLRLVDDPSNRRGIARGFVGSMIWLLPRSSEALDRIIASHLSEKSVAVPRTKITSKLGITF